MKGFIPKFDKNDFDLPEFLKQNPTLVDLLIKNKISTIQSETDIIIDVIKNVDNLNILETLLQAGMNPNGHSIDKYGTTPLCAAAQYNTSALDMLIKYKAIVNKANKNGTTPLMSAVEYGNTESIIKLLDHKADIDQVTPRGTSALIWSCHSGYPECTKILLERGAYPNGITDEETTALRNACSVQYDSVEVLLKFGANPNLVGSYGVTPLMTAARLAPLATVELLLEAGANINAQDYKGHTALFDTFKKLETLKYLLEKGIDYNLTNKDGKTALEFLIDLQNDQKSNHNPENYESVIQTLKIFIDHKEVQKTFEGKLLSLNQATQGKSKIPL